MVTLGLISRMFVFDAVVGEGILGRVSACVIIRVVV